MTQIEKIRQMSAEELAAYLFQIADEGLTDYCACKHCEECKALYAAEEAGEQYCCKCTDELCIAAAVIYLESEVEEP